MRPLRLLLIAPTCDGDDVGEAWVAFQWVRRLAEFHDVTVLTYYKLGRTPASVQIPNARVIEWPESTFFARYERFNSMLKPSFVAFYRKAHRWILEALARGEEFDLCHQVTPVAMRYPCPALGVGIPFIIGPVGGGLKSPPAFVKEESTAQWFVGLRAIDWWRIRFDPFLRRSFTDAACVLGIAEYVRQSIPYPIRRFEILSETAIESIPTLVERRGKDGAGPLRLLFVGRLIRTKGARDAIRAMSELADLNVRLDIVGDGPDHGECEGLSKSLGLENRVFFHGSQPRDVVDQFYDRADVFVFPSYREPGGNVVFEAMAFGLPLVVVDRGGPGAAVDDNCAIRLSAKSPTQLSSDIAAAIKRIASTPGLLDSMGRASIRRVHQVGMWDAKVATDGEIYDDILSSGGSLDRIKPKV